MSVDENKIVSGSKLSAEVEPFVPSKFRNDASGSNSALSPTVLQQLPSYMTNCYPFVQESARSPVPHWQTQQQPYLGQQLMAAPPPPPPPPPTNIVSVYDICGTPTTNQSYHYKHPQRGVSFNNISYTMTINANQYYPLSPYQTQYTYDRPTRIKPPRNKPRTQVGQGIKNDEDDQNVTSDKCLLANTEQQNSEMSKITNSSQTDFAENICDLTLLEKPSSLFKNIDHFNDVEDSESDSGYSSPLNRNKAIEIKKCANSESRDMSLSTHKLESNSLKDCCSPLVCSSSLNKVTKSQLDKRSEKSSKHSHSSQRTKNHCLENKGVTSNSHSGQILSRCCSKGPNVSISKNDKSVHNSVISPVAKSEKTVSSNGVSEAKQVTSSTSKKNKNNQKNNSKNETTSYNLTYPGILFLNNATPECLGPIELRLQDEKEYPQLESTAQTSIAVPKHQKSIFSYSDALKRKNSTLSPSNVSIKETVEVVRIEEIIRQSPQVEAPLKETRFTRRKKPVELVVNQTPRENKRKPAVKSKTPLQYNFADLIAVLTKQQGKQADEKSKAVKKTALKHRDRDKIIKSANPLDSTAPTRLRGKERETPAKKRPSPLKKVILKEREERKQLRQLQEGVHSINITPSNQVANTGSGDASQNCQIDIPTPKSSEMSPVSQLSPVSLSPLSPGNSPLSSEGNSPVAGILGAQDSLKMKLHSRRFREYCNQMLDKEIDSNCTALLQDLVRFQDRLYHKDPMKARAKRRVVLGLREVTKHLKLKKLKCIIISPNLERIQSKGGLDDALSNIIKIAQDQNVPFVFALGRRALGLACSKPVPVSCVGIFNYEGSEINYKQMIESSAKAREAYRNMVAMLENVSPEATSKQLFAHLGHSRTPSASSAVSTTLSKTENAAGCVNQTSYCDTKKWDNQKCDADNNKNHSSNTIQQRRIETWIANTSC